MNQPRPVRQEQQPPYDASDPDHVHAREKSSKRRDDRRKEGLRYIMADPKGRAWMRHLIAEKLFTRVGAQRPAVIFTGNSSTFYNAALKEMGDLISSEIATLTPREFRQMEDEGDMNAS